MNHTNETQKQSLEESAQVLTQVLSEVKKLVIGQENMTRCLILGLLTEGHVLLEGLPGLAKTLAVKSLASAIDADFKRLQFTPDLLPSDLIGTLIYRPDTHEFTPKKGPLFANIILADEINRAPAKVQSALLEAMAEKQVTIGEVSYPLPSPFLVLATQNPIEQEGTYPLPEAQMDRFMFKVKVGYPSRDEEKQIIEAFGKLNQPKISKVISPETILSLKEKLDSVYVDPKIEDYILRIVLATRKSMPMKAEEADPEKLSHLRQFIRVGASPRASLFLHKASRAQALLNGKHFVSPDDIKQVAFEVLRHRLVLTFDAEARGYEADSVINELLETVAIP